nr:uncharacterized protein CTRU02_15120 [Colletotrichum truncatum]KAF6781413.1 hypothetical protein CTRU02_15120 [Colletotrichum truncatum]
MPTGDGFVPISHPERHKLPLKMLDDHDQPMNIFGITVYHQLHCLHYILQSWVSFVYSEKQENFFPSHILHCFDYIRFGLMCGVDTALEGASLVEGPRRGTLGLGTVHICHDWDALFTWVENENAQVESKRS